MQTYIYGITEHFYNFSIFHIVFFSFRVTSRPLHQGRELNGILQWQADLFIIPLWTWVVSMDILYKRVRETRRSKYLKGCLRQSLFFAEILGFYILKLDRYLSTFLRIFYPYHCRCKARFRFNECCNAHNDNGSVRICCNLQSYLLLHKIGTIFRSTVTRSISDCAIAKVFCKCKLQNERL